MIFDWYNGGDWGGIPVRRLGHVMADVINAADEVYRLLNLGLGLGQSNPLLGLQFKKGILNSDKITILGTGINADPAWYDGIRVRHRGHHWSWPGGADCLADGPGRRRCRSRRL